MLTPARTRLLLLSLALLAGMSQADDFMLGAAPLGTPVLDAHSDCDTSAGQSSPSIANTRVIYHDGQRAPVSVPVEVQGAVVGDVSSSTTAVADSQAAPVRLPSAEPVVPQKPRGGSLRWQAVLPGSIK